MTMIRENKQVEEVRSEFFERRRFLVTSMVFGAVTALRGILGWWPSPANSAQTPDRETGVRGILGKMGTVPLPFRARVAGFSVDGGSTPGETITVKMTISTSGSGTKAVPWTLYRGNAVLKSDTKLNVTAGSSFEVSATWQATEGNHVFLGKVDPFNTLNEPVSEQGNNVSQPVTRDFTSWRRWSEGAKRGVREAVPRWIHGTRLVGVLINGPTATAGKVLFPPDLFPNLKGQMLAAGAPKEVVNGFMGAVADALQGWASSISVPGLPWYPAFAAMPSPVAPPMPNLPTPVASLSQSASLLNAATLAAAIKLRIGNAAGKTGGNEAIDEFCSWFSAGFNAAIAASIVKGVLGTGPVPTFAPPYVPVGPVVGGIGASVTEPLLSTLPRWP